MSPEYRILFEGERWLGSNAASSARALRRLGHSVRDEDYNAFIPIHWSSLALRAVRKVFEREMVRDYNRRLLGLAGDFRPHIFLAFKGAFVVPETIRRMRALGINTYNFYPDVSVFSHGVPWLARALTEYDCVFSTKKFTARDLERKGYRLRNFEYLPHGYDPDAHHPVAVNPDEVPVYECDVAFIGIHSPAKETILRELVGRLPDPSLVIWGNGWDRMADPALKSRARRREVLGTEYIKALCASKIALGLLSERVHGASSGDQITSRTFNIPATGTFMIHQRTDEVLEYYEEGKEIECFGTPEELAEKIRFYLAHPEKRQAVAAAGYRRCVPAYSQDQRMKVILDWHEAHRK